MYLTYQEYIEMGGTLNEALFNEFSYEAQVQIDYLTFNRLATFEEIPEAVKRCLFKLIKLMESKNNLLESSSNTDGNLGISSQSNDGVSVSYNTISGRELYTLLSETEVNKLIKTYLYGIKDSKGRIILHRGLYSDDVA